MATTAWKIYTAVHVLCTIVFLLMCIVRGGIAVSLPITCSNDTRAQAICIGVFFRTREVKMGGCWVGNTEYNSMCHERVTVCLMKGGFSQSFGTLQAFLLYSG